MTAIAICSRFTPGVTNDRSCYLWWGQDLVNGAGTSAYTVQFNFSATAWGNNHTSSEFAVVSCAAENTLKKSALNANYRAKDANWLFDLTQLDANHGGNAASCFRRPGVRSTAIPPAPSPSQQVLSTPSLLTSTPLPAPSTTLSPLVQANQSHRAHTSSLRASAQ